MATAAALLSGTAGLVLLTGIASTAHADPSFVSAYAGVGADVTQDVYAGLSGASPSPGNGATSGTFDNTKFYTPLHSSDATSDLTIDSFDASPAGGTTLNPGCITTKLGGPTFDRPNSSSAGIAALTDATTGTTWVNSAASCTGTGVSVTGQIDFARSARVPKTTPGPLTFIPFGRDALGILIYDHNTQNLAGSPLTNAELKALYSSSTGTSTINGQTVKACLTITGSTPRSNLEADIGVSDSTASTAATAAGCNNIQQNSGNSFYSTVSGFASNVDAVIPISAGSWIGQVNGVGLDRSQMSITNGVYLASLDTFGLPYTGTAPSEAPNTTYYQSSYGYNVFTVLPTSSISGGFADQALQSLFVGTSSALCTSTNQTTVHTFGFDSLTGSEGTCGATTLTGSG